jgi:ribonuclease D
MNALRATISKEEIADYPLAEYEGSIYVVQTVDDANKAVNFLKTHTILGFDTETRPSFRKGKTNTIALLQLSTDKDCFLFRLNMIGVPPSLKKLLTTPSVKKIGLSLHDDFRALNKIMPNFIPANFIDLQNYVKGFNIEDKSLMKIYAILFGKRIAKSQRLSNWEADFLTERQKQYAALDAWATREIYMKLEARAMNQKPTR